jgi:serine/threonine-protein kinase
VPVIGDLLGGKYRVLAKLGEGGMGSVFRAENVVTGKQVALKWMHPTIAGILDSRERLLREARAGSRLHHPNVVDVYDVVQDQATLFIVMELLQGETLRAYLERNPTPDVSEFIALLLPALAGVAAAHDVGVIHRDLKPDNIFLVGSPGSRALTVKVVDFGVAKFTAGQGVTLTDTGKPLGTPLYMSLEQLRGDKDLDVRTDVYAFGVMLYEAISGQHPYVADSLPELAIKVATTNPAPIRSVRSDVPAPLARLIDSAVARDRSQRPANIHAMAAKLEAFAFEPEPVRRSRPRGSRPPAGAQVFETDPQERPCSASQDTLTAHELQAASRLASRPRRPVLWFGLAAGLFVASAAVYWPLTNKSTPAPVTAQVTPAPETHPLPSTQPPSQPATPSVRASETNVAAATLAAPQVQARPSVIPNPAPAEKIAPPDAAAAAPRPARAATARPVARRPPAVAKPAPQTKLAKPAGTKPVQSAEEILAF